jgi:hypothetical protein
MIPRTFSRVINRSAALPLPRVGGPGFSASASLLHLSAFVLALLVLTFDAGAAGTSGTALQSAYTALNDMVNGYGKQLLTVIGFAVAAIGFIASNATSVIMKFVGYAIFLGVGLAGATSLVGAVV